VVEETRQYSAAEMERTMKVQDVLLKAMAKKITWWAAAEIIGVCDRTMRRWRERMEEGGYAGLADRRKGRPSAQRIPVAMVEEVLRLYREEYFDLNIRHFHEKLQDKHKIGLSYTWVQKALQGAGLVAKRHKRGPHRRRRPRRPLPGMLLHIDGSKHQWLNDDRWHDLIVILDDATSEIYYAQLVEEESTRTVMAGLREVIENKGLFCALYSDRGSHFFVTMREGEKVDKHRLTQVGRAMKELGVQMIAAYSPQARGRSERSFGTWQGRLPQELRLAGITTVDGANVFLRERYMGEFNASFSVAAAEKGTAFRRTSRSDLNWIFTVQTERVVAKDNTVAMGSRLWQIDKTRFRNTLAGSTVTIHEHLDETVSIRFGPHVVGRFDSQGAKLIGATSEKRRGKGGSMEAGENQRQVFTGSHTPLEIPHGQRDSHFPTAPTTVSAASKAKTKPSTKAAA
jgi:transposase